MQFIDLYEHGRPFAFSSNYANKNYSACSVHWHDFIELLYTYSGNSIIRCDSTIYNTKAGDLVVVNSNELHNFQGKERSCIRFNKAFLPEMYRNNKIFKSYISNDKTIISIFEKLAIYHKEIDNNKYKSFDIMGAIYELADYLLENYQMNEEEKKEYFSKKNKSSKILAALNHITNSYNEKISAKALAEMCFLSEQHFCKLFKEHTGLSPISYINNYRMEQAAILLKETDKQITEIATLTGFDDLCYFSKNFKKHFNKTPTEYKLKG